jgi:Arc/MetJ-type ribon-helix-helix transcriptional regulator
MPKLKVTITLDPELYTWIEQEVKKRRFASVSHAIEYALTRLKEEEE